MTLRGQLLTLASVLARVNLGHPKRHKRGFFLENDPSRDVVSFCSHRAEAEGGCNGSNRVSRVTRHERCGSIHRSIGVLCKTSSLKWLAGAHVAGGSGMGNL